MRTITAPVGALLAAALLAGGCGGGSDDGGDQGTTAELARFAPSDAIGFGQVAVRPSGELEETIDSILAHFPKGDKAGAKLIEEIDEELDDDHLTYRKDIEPWLGENAAAFVTRLGVDPAGEPRVADDDAVIVVEATDEELARRVTFDAARRDGRVRESSYHGVEIVEQYTSANQGSFAVFDGVLAASGGPAGIRAAIDASRGESLEDSEELDGFLGEREGETIAVGYLDPGAVLGAYERAGLVTPAQREAITDGYGVAADQPVLAALEVSSSRVSLEAAGASTEQSKLHPGSELIDDVPDDAWLAFGLGDLGASVDAGLDQLSAAGAPQLWTSRLNRALRGAAGITLDDLDSLGDFAAFASGESIFGLQAGAVVEAPGAAGAALLRAVRRVVASQGGARIDSLELEGAEGFAVIPAGIPAAINVASANGRVVAALGDAATEALLEGGGGSDAVAAARETLGGGDFDVGFLLRLEPVLELVGGVGGGDDPDWRRARPYLDQISAIAAGSRLADDESQVRFVVELED